MSKKGQPKSINPLAVIFKFLQNKSRVEIWLYDNVDIRLEGKILGFDEFMNIVLDETFEIKTKTKTSRPLGKLLVKGENVTLIRAVTENVWFLSYTHYRSALKHRHINIINIPSFLHFLLDLAEHRRDCLEEIIRAAVWQKICHSLLE